MGAGSIVRGTAYVGAVMSEANQFREYAEEALRWVSESTTEEEKRTLTELACMPRPHAVAVIAPLARE